MDEDFTNTKSGLLDYLESDDFESDLKSPWQQFLPDNLIFEIFWFLDIQDLISASKTCKTWWRIAQDDFLWKDLLCKKCRFSKNVSPKDNNTWKTEYKRLFYNSCFVASETLTEHVDEVYHVNFSRSGRMFSTVGKDGTVKIWNIGNPTTLYGSLDLRLKSDSDYTRFSEFNESETMIMVACLIGTGFWSREGLIVVASVEPNPEVLYAVHTDFCNFRGSWVNDRSFLSATIIHHFEDFRDTFCLKQYEVPLSCKPIKFKHKSYADILEKLEDKGKTVLNLNRNASGSHDFVRVIDCQKLRNLASDLSPEILCPSHNKNIDEVDENHTDCDNCTKCSAECLPNTENPLLNKKYDKLIIMAQDCNELSTTTCGDIMFYGLPSDTKDDDDDDDDDDSVSDMEDKDKEDTDFNQKERKKANCKEVYKICCQGGLIGVALSPDQRYLAYNYRRLEIDDEEAIHSYSHNMEIKAFDVLLGQDTGMCYKGHKAEYTHTSLSYIFPSISTDYVASGSESADAHVWDRYYGFCLGLLKHTVGLNGTGVNSVAFSPADQEVLISTGDDYKVKVWRSKRRMKELSELNQGLTDEIGTCSKFEEDPRSSLSTETKSKDTSTAKAKKVKKETGHGIGCCFFNKKKL
ncbi:hypothetical protein KUTeg_017750 [Tegillarca granosa]|uniref:F-box domain-containing protein n=1 Tax=Tegillarca granosa TaxID=220873 RepID=A0ABQ9EKQ2_TEGGR|nr:hypothetical protein KUTeg_017750 [Tegillarca granosa]